MECQACVDSPRGICFKHKLRSIQFDAGAKTNPRNYYDSEALDYTFGGDEGREEYLDIVEGMPLKWRQEGNRRVPYRKDKVGDYVKADEKDMTRVMYGSKKRAAKPGD